MSRKQIERMRIERIEEEFSARWGKEIMEELICREGTVHSVIFQNAENGYTVLRLLTEEGEVITVVGCIPCVAPGEHLTVTGTWETHPQHGEQLNVQELERSLPEEEDEIYSYLSSGICKGVGPTTARRIVNGFK